MYERGLGGSLTIRKKLWLLTLCIGLGVAAMLTVLLQADRRVAMQEREQAVRGTVEAAHGVLVYYHQQAEKGAMSAEDAKRAARETLRGLRYAGEEYFFITDMQANIVMHPIKPELEGKDGSAIKDPGGNYLFMDIAKTVAAGGAGYVHYLWPKPGESEPVGKVSYVTGFVPWGWIVGSGIYVDEVERAFQTRAAIAMAGGAAMLGLLLLICRLVAASITRPLGRAVEVANAVAAGDLTQQIDSKAGGEVGLLTDALREMNGSLTGIVGRVRQASDTIATASNEIAAGNLDLSARTEQQASALEETASSMEQLTSTVRNNTDNAGTANALAISAAEVAEKGGAVVKQVVHTMAGIETSARRIEDIIGTIDGIAFQTNILALNAAVEAARAGEQGRGFAVVASEVRSLAQRSAVAAKEIKTLIGDSVEQVNAGSRLATDAGSTMDVVVASVKRVTSIMGEILAASREQASGIEHVNRAIVKMEQVTQQNAALVEQAAAAAGAMRDQADALTEAVGVFRIINGISVGSVPATVLSPRPVARAMPAIVNRPGT